MKKIIAFALSIAVLFAFAACEAGTIPPYYGKTVESITLLSAPDYIVGETLNPADLSFRVVYDNGEEVTRTGADLGLAPTTTGTGSTVEIDSDGSYEFTDATAKTFGIKYGTSRPTSGTVTEKDIWTCTITPVAASTVDFVVDPTNASKEYKGAVSFEGVVITAKLPKGDKVVSATIADIDADDFVVTQNEAEKTVTITVAPSATNITLSSAWTATYTTVEKEVTGITFEYNDELFSNTPAEKITTTLDDIEFKVHVTYNTGKPEDFATRAAFESAGGKIDFNGYYDEATKVQDVSKSTISFTATVEYEDYKNTSVALRGSYANDYPTVFTAELKSEYKQDSGKVEAPYTVKKDMFDFTFSGWASGASYEDGPAGVADLIIENAEILSGETEEHTVYFYWGDEDLRDKVNSGDPVKVTVPIKAAE